ncbi:hypothetical protein RDWZM_004974 [Blomia tropicalis]|uniref:Fatty acid desaturase domain-containing protein n=1 Tax=Blomia tropicalis TaxID=40697 RepID=A0A9Q0M767_BLOTA|nr:hypothetical protein RDWZM_004974 [Blomia tropicalis]
MERVTDKCLAVVAVDVELRPEEIPKNIFKKLYEKCLKVKWTNLFVLVALHLTAIVGYIYNLNHDVKLNTVWFVVLIGLFSGLGMSVGAHRLWAHRSFKARLPLRIFLVLCQTMTMNGSAFSYARDHRTHHKYSDTDADPKNPSRGLFYSHVGWWMLKKSQNVKDHGNKLDFEDLRKDWMLRMQHRFYSPLFILFGLILPTIIPYYGWNENILTSFYLCGVIRTVVVLHHLFTVNSIAHFFGHRPYDFRIRPTENRLVIYLSLGEGNHNYHHTFPYDYSSSEKKAWEFFNPSTLFIDLNRMLGLAYDCKKASRAVIEGTIKRKGIPAHFDPPMNLFLRIISGTFDWVIGLLMAMWPIYPIVLFKYLTGQAIIVM